MERIIRGIMRYRITTREQMVKEFVQVKNNPHVSFEYSYWMFCCIIRVILIDHFFISQKRFFSHAWTVEWSRLDSQRHMSAICSWVIYRAENQHHHSSNFIDFFLFVFSEKCWKFGTKRTTLSRRILQLWTGRSWVGLRHQQHSTHNCLWSQRLQSNELTVSFKAQRRGNGRSTKNITIACLAMWTCGELKSWAISAVERGWHARSVDFLIGNAIAKVHCLHWSRE